MKLSQSWLHEWVDPTLNTQALSERLTMAGLEVEDISPIVTNDRHDEIIEISITPNRGDCLSVKGMAREIAALTTKKLKNLVIKPVPAKHDGTLPIKIHASKACAHYVGRVIRNVKADAATPTWLKDRLLDAGMKSISPIVDVTNYVMLELGQPMHAFDLNCLKGGIHVRHANVGEQLTILDGTQKILDADTLIIADDLAPLAIAGVMGGLDSSVTSTTTAIFLESAYFSAKVVARQRQHYQLNSDSAYRFERGVDPALQLDAIERATQLICEIVGGEPGPVIDMQGDVSVPPKPITLAQSKIKQVLGCDIPEKTVSHIFDALNFVYQHKNNEWQVTPPSYRFDIALPEDLIEELARIDGYDKIPARQTKANLQNQSVGELAFDDKVRQIWQDYGYHEIIAYSFIEPAIAHAFDPEHAACELINPISADMKAMRTNLWPGLVNTLRYNTSRQQERVRLFELGVCFVPDANGVIEEKPRLGGIITGLAMPEQWGEAKRAADFFDLKGDLQAFFATLGLTTDFQRAAHPALHPGQSALISSKDEAIGIVGAVHPALIQQFDLPKNTFVFELDLATLRDKRAEIIQEISKFPEIRRDIAILVERTVPAKAISDTIKSVAGDWLKSIFIFDLYQGKGIAENQKSVALGLILQHPTRTLVDEEVATLIANVVAALKGTFGAQLRS